MRRATFQNRIASVAFLGFPPPYINSRCGRESPKNRAAIVATWQPWRIYPVEADAGKTQETAYIPSSGCPTARRPWRHHDWAPETAPILRILARLIAVFIFCDY